jgi:hypothetical protein
LEARDENIIKHNIINNNNNNNMTTNQRHNLPANK